MFAENALRLKPHMFPQSYSRYKTRKSLERHTRMVMFHQTLRDLCRINHTSQEVQRHLNVKLYADRNSFIVCVAKRTNRLNAVRGRKSVAFLGLGKTHKLPL